MTTPPTAGRGAILLASVALLGLMLVYAAQTGLGHWQVDEFRYFADHDGLGWLAYFERFEVSPRPLSELLIYGYGALVLAFDRSFVSAALLSIWGGSLLAIAAVAYVTMPRARGRVPAAAALALAPMLFTLQTGGVTEMFYWPIASVAYLPMLAAVTAAMFLLTDEARPGWCGVALMVAALCHEIGAAAAIGFALAAALLGIRPIRWWLVPALAGGLVMMGLVLFRSHYVDLGSDTKPYTGRLVASAAVALRQMAVDLATTGSFAHDPAGVLAALAQKVAFAGGFALTWLGFGAVRPNRRHVALGAGIAAAVYFSLLGAYFHYGELCCERQASARQWLIELGFIMVAASVLRGWPPRRAGWVGPALLVASLLPVIGQVKAIRADFAQMPMANAAHTRTWQSGLMPGPRMQLYLPPDNADMLIHGTSTALGTYDLRNTPNDPADIVAAAGRFFAKRTVDVCQAWQTAESFLIDGRFIPACPPHDGPPDRVFNTGPDGKPIF